MPGYPKVARNYYYAICIFSLFLTTCSSDDLGDQNSDDVLVSSIAISGTSIDDGGSSQLVALVTPSNATNTSVAWSASDGSVATISNLGLLPAVSNGSVSVKAQAEDNSGTYGEQTFTISGVDFISGAITVNTVQDILMAIANAIPGDIIYVSGGNYVFESTMTISGSGSNDNLIYLMADPNDTERPKFDFSSMSENSSNRGLILSGDYWYIKGMDVFGAGIDLGLEFNGSSPDIGAFEFD